MESPDADPTASSQVRRPALQVAVLIGGAAVVRLRDLAAAQNRAELQRPLREQRLHVPLEGLAMQAPPQGDALGDVPRIDRLGLGVDLVETLDVAVEPRVRRGGSL